MFSFLLCSITTVCATSSDVINNQGRIKMRQKNQPEKLFFVSCLCILLLGAAHNASAQTTSTPSNANPVSTIDVWRAGLAGTEQPSPGAVTTMTVDANEEVVVPGEDVVQKLTDLEHRWADAVMRRSKPNLSRLLSSDFVSIGEHANSSATPVSKQAYVNRVVKEPQTEMQKFSVQTIRVYGDTAIINVRYMPVASGKTAPVEVVVTDVWVKRNNRWQVVSRHASQLPSVAAP